MVIKLSPYIPNIEHIWDISSENAIIYPINVHGNPVNITPLTISDITIVDASAVDISIGLAFRNLILYKQMLAGIIARAIGSAKSANGISQK